MMKNIEIGSIRPPSESESLLVRVTRGCHWNKCYFCGLYKSMQFSMRPIEETIEDIAMQAQIYHEKNFTSCFLQDGDALVLKTDYLLRILDALNRYFPNLQYITTYARADSITRKTLSELQALRQAGLNHLYCGMETGSDQILKLINKGFQADTVVQSGCMAKEAGMILSEFILLGIGGKELSEENAAATAEALKLLRLSPKILTAGAKASGSGGVAVSALEMAQNSIRYNWTRAEVDDKLRQIMGSIYDASAAAAKEYGLGDDLIAGNDIAAFKKISEAMIAQGL